MRMRQKNKKQSLYKNRKRRMEQIIITFVIFSGMLLCVFTINVKAEEFIDRDINKIEKDASLYTELEPELKEVDQIFAEMFEDGISFQELVHALMAGKLEQILASEGKSVLELLLSLAADTFQKSKGAMLALLLLGILSAVFSNISEAFETKGSAQVSFYIVSLLLASILLRAMREVSALGSEVLANIVLFMQTLIPTFIAAAAFTAGAGSASVFYASSMLAIWLVEVLLKQVLLPFAEFYIIINFVNHLLQEDLLTQLMELIKSVILFLLKAVLGIIIGIQTIQSLLAPMLYSLKASAVHKAIAAIPGVGGGLNVVTQTIVSSALVVKNSVGVAGMLVLILIAIAPVIELLVIVMLYKITAAMLGVISEKRLSMCVSNMGEGIKLIMKTVVTAMVLFMISIALIAAFTNRGV